MDNEKIRLRLENAKLKGLVDELKKEVETLCKLPANEMTLNQFVTSFLTNHFASDKMPKVGGIYAYYKPSTEQLYIGQAKDMARRLKQHFKNGKVKINGHDSEFKDKDGWQFYVLEYINKNNKADLDDREAYWIAMAKNATRNKKLVDKKAAKELRQRAVSGLSTSNKVVKEVKQKGTLTNRTRGNNVRM